MTVHVNALYNATSYAENFDAGMGTWTTANIGTGSYIGWYSGIYTPSSGTGPQAGDVTGKLYVYKLLLQEVLIHLLLSV